MIAITQDQCHQPPIVQQQGLLSIEQPHDNNDQLEPTPTFPLLKKDLSILPAVSQPKNNILEILVDALTPGNDIFINSEEDFKALKDATIIHGDIHINCSILSPHVNLHNIRIVLGDVIINKPSQAALQQFGFKNLLSIGGNLSLTCGDIENFRAFPHLQHVKAIRINRCSSFQDFTGLESATSLGEIRLNKLKSFKSFQGLQNLQTLDSLMISNCHGFTDFQYLESLRTITGKMLIDWCLNVTSFQGLSHIQSIDSLLLYSNYALEGFKELSSLQKLQELVLFGKSRSSEHAVKNFKGLENITTLRRLEVRKVSDFFDFSGLENLTCIEDEFYIAELTSLQSLAALSHVKSINQIRKVNCPLIDDFSELNTHVKISKVRLHNKPSNKLTIPHA